MTHNRPATSSTTVPSTLPCASTVPAPPDSATSKANAPLISGYGGFRLARRPRAPGESSIARVHWSIDHGQTWSYSGELLLPTGHTETATLDLLLALKGLPRQPPGLQWRIDARHLRPDAAAATGPRPDSLLGEDPIVQPAGGRARSLRRSMLEPGKR
jgi:hypothetical protein